MAYLPLFVAALLVAFDFQNVLAWWRGRTIKPVSERSYDFTIVVPLFGDPRYFEHRGDLRRYQAQVLVALETTPPVMAEFADDLEREGWRVERLRIADPNPAALIAAALPSVTTTYMLRLDADTSIGDELPQAVAAVDQAGAELCSIKCAVANRTNIVTRLQALEYRMAMLSRHFRPWLTSGACFVARTEALRLIMARHSMWTPGEDIETGRVALALRMTIRHLDIVVHTDAPATWRGLIRQRQLWWAGSFRHWWINFDRNLLHLPVMTSYYLAVIWFAIVFKWWTMINPRELIANLPILIGAYIFVTAVSNLQVLSPWMIVFPLYSLAQVAVMPPLGALTYLRLARHRRRLGRYPFGYRRRRLLESFPSQAAVSALEARLSWFVTEPRLDHRRAGVSSASR